MGTDIANWLQVNILSNSQVFQSLIALIMLIFAGFLFSEKPTEKSLFRSRRVWGSMLFVFAIFVFLLANIPDLGDVFIALATIVLACVAIFSFEESRRLRVENKQMEERDRKERKLITIMKWATDIAQCETAVPLPQYPTAEIVQSTKGLEEEKAKKLGKILEDTHNKAIFTNLIMRYQSLDTMGKRMVLIAKTLDKQFNCNLEALAQGTAKKLHAHVKLGLRWIDGEATEDEYKTHCKSLVGSAKSFLEKAEEAVD